MLTKDHVEGSTLFAVDDVLDCTTPHRQLLKNKTKNNGERKHTSRTLRFESTQLPRII